MSANQQPTKTNNNKEEEVDLGSLFVIIGKGFSNFFNFIGTIFTGIFNFSIAILIFLKKNSMKIGMATIIGFAAGIFLEVNSSSRYESNLLVEPNFESTRQLYNTINYYNDLVQQKDTVALQKIFSLDNASAASIKKFEIKPVMVDTDIINLYGDLILSLDTLIVRSYEYLDFKAAFTNYDYKVHKISVVAEKNNVFDKLGEVIIASVANNKYFNRVKVLKNESLNRTDSLYRQNLIQIDSLRKVYILVMLEEAKKQTIGTSIDFGGGKRTTKELELFETNIKINLELIEIAEEKSKKYDVINVISNFQPIGYKIKGVTKNYVFILGVLGAGLMITFLLLVKLNRFLENYKK